METRRINGEMEIALIRTVPIVHINQHRETQLTMTGGFVSHI